MMRVSINTSCARVMKELYRTGKEVFSAADIIAALTTVGRGGTTTRRDYMGIDGYLSKRGFIKRVQDGWVATDSSMKQQKIEVCIHVGNEHLVGEVSTAIGEALEGFKGITHTMMGV